MSTCKSAAPVLLIASLYSIPFSVSRRLTRWNDICSRYIFIQRVWHSFKENITNEKDSTSSLWLYYLERINHIFVQLWPAAAAAAAVQSCAVCYTLFSHRGRSPTFHAWLVAPYYNKTLTSLKSTEKIYYQQFGHLFVCFLNKTKRLVSAWFIANTISLFNVEIVIRGCRLVGPVYMLGILRHMNTLQIKKGRWEHWGEVNSLSLSDQGESKRIKHREISILNPGKEEKKKRMTVCVWHLPWSISAISHQRYAFLFERRKSRLYLYSDPAVERKKFSFLGILADIEELFEFLYTDMLGREIWIDPSFGCGWD